MSIFETHPYVLFIHDLKKKKKSYVVSFKEEISAQNLQNSKDFSTVRPLHTSESIYKYTEI